MVVKRYSEDEFFQRINKLWEQFHDRPEMFGVSFEEFKKECFEEFRKQQQMSDKQLEKYRNDNYKAILNETDKLLTKEEKQKLNDEDAKTITIADELMSKNPPKL